MIALAVLILLLYLCVAYNLDKWPFRLKVNVDSEASAGMVESAENPNPPARLPNPERRDPDLIIGIRSDGRMRILAHDSLPKQIEEDIMKESQEMDHKYGRPVTA